MFQPETSSFPLRVVQSGRNVVNTSVFGQVALGKDVIIPPTTESIGKRPDRQVHAGGLELATN